MTISQAKQKLISWLISQVGITEGANNWNKYAEDPLLKQLLGWYPQNQPWCDLFTDEAFIVCFGLSHTSAMTYQPIGKGSALCRQSAQYFKDNGAWCKTPELCDVVFFYSGGDINHQGIVIEIGSGKITVIEGNRSDKVSKCTYNIGDGTIAGYGRPKWSVVAEEDDAAISPTYAPEAKPVNEPEYCNYVYKVNTNLLKLGNHGPQVENMQHLLNDHGFDCGEADGKFGDNTYRALLEFQEVAGIETDGEWGGESFSAMWNYQ